MFDIHSLMTDLSKRYPSFRHEVDFQKALVEQICHAMPNSEPQQEHRIGNMKIDIYLPTKRVVIELKHRKPHRSAVVNGRYGFLRDIEKIERAVRSGEADSGFAVLLTNCQSLWDPTARAKDSNFLIHEGRMVTGKLAWSANTAESTKNGRGPIYLTGSYRLHWRDYSNLGVGENPQFQYLAVPV